MNAIYEEAKDRGASTVELDYWVTNEGAERFYKKEGFEQTRTVVAKELK
jgi:ribosomal protein S18 acetylase RimI-like enzyme